MDIGLTGYRSTMEGQLCNVVVELLTSFADMMLSCVYTCQSKYNNRVVTVDELSDSAGEVVVLMVKL